MKQKKHLSKGTALFAAICWTITTVLWAVNISVRISYEYYSWLLLLQVVVLLLSLFNSILNWHRYANYDKNNEQTI